MREEGGKGSFFIFCFSQCFFFSSFLCSFFLFIFVFSCPSYDVSSSYLLFFKMFSLVFFLLRFFCFQAADFFKFFRFFFSRDRASAGRPLSPKFALSFSFCVSSLEVFLLNVGGAFVEGFEAQGSQPALLSSGTSCVSGSRPPF